MKRIVLSLMLGITLAACSQPPETPSPTGSPAAMPTATPAASPTEASQAAGSFRLTLEAGEKAFTVETVGLLQDENRMSLVATGPSITVAATFPEGFIGADWKALEGQALTVAEAGSTPEGVDDSVITVQEENPPAQIQGGQLAVEKVTAAGSAQTLEGQATLKLQDIEYQGPFTLTVTPAAD